MTTSISASFAHPAHRGFLAGAAVALVLFMPSAHAKTGDRNQPMVTKQDSVSGFNAPNTVTTLTGHIVIAQGTMKATGNDGKIYLDADSQVSRIVLTGNPAHIQQMDDKNNLMTGEAPTLDYDNINGVAVLTPNAVVTEQGTGDAHADKITYDTQTTHFTGVGNVSATYLAKQRPATAAPANPQPATGTTAPAPST
ncbi:lipopolysaccharide export system protein LptA [Dyella lipolytica]|nr:lipopolysaccharide transport periplasmic protein LptA [Dyella lipolytica]GLQ47301.1 lipopolysaccharide export system protein LptA [Dyella lipolytica]